MTSASHVNLQSISQCLPNEDLKFLHNLVLMAESLFGIENALAFEHLCIAVDEVVSCHHKLLFATCVCSDHEASITVA